MTKYFLLLFSFSIIGTSLSSCVSSNSSVEKRIKKQKKRRKKNPDDCPQIDC